MGTKKLQMQYDNVIIGSLKLSGGKTKRQVLFCFVTTKPRLIPTIRLINEVDVAYIIIIWFFLTLYIVG